MCARAKAAISSSPTSRKARAGLRDLQTLYWIGKYLYHVDDAGDLVEHGVFTKDEYKTFQKAEAFLWTCAAICTTSRAAPRSGCPSTCSRNSRKALGYTDDNPRRAVERFMRTYFLVAKDVGDLTRIFCAALEEQNRKSRPSRPRLLPGFLKPRTPSRRFLMSRTGGSPRAPDSSARIRSI